jgi:glycosyltransferase involved in cell wall biosynthesis
MRILFFSSIFPQPGKPTRGIYCLHLCKALAAAHEVKVISPWSWLERLRYGGWRGAFARPTETAPGGLDVEYPCYYYPPGALRSAYGWFMWHSVGRCLRRALEEFRPDCVLSYWAHPDGAVAVRAAHSINVPAGIIIGGSDVLLLPRGSRREKVVSALRACDAVIAVGQDLRDKAVELGSPVDTTHVVYQGLDTELFRPGDRLEARGRLGLPAEEKALLWVGNLLPVKGLDVLLRACANLNDGGQRFHLYLVGDGPLRKALEAECRARGLWERVSFLGPRLPHQLPDWYRAADLTVLPSRSEGYPNVLRESLACGTPFVASEVGSIPEIAAEDERNLLVPPEDAAALTAALHEALRAPRGEPAETFRPLTWAESGEQVLDLFRPLIARRRGEHAEARALAAVS